MFNGYKLLFFALFSLKIKTKFKKELGQELLQKCVNLHGIFVMPFEGPKILKPL